MSVTTFYLRATVTKYRPFSGKSWKMDFFHFLPLNSCWVDKQSDVSCSCKKSFVFEKSTNISFCGRSHKMAVFSTRNLLTSTLLAFANKAARRNLDTFHQYNNSSSFTRRYFQSNIKTHWTNIIQKRRTGFYGDKNFNLVVVFCGFILHVV